MLRLSFLESVKEDFDCFSLPCLSVKAYQLSIFVSLAYLLHFLMEFSPEDLFAIVRKVEHSWELPMVILLSIMRQDVTAVRTLHCFDAEPKPFPLEVFIIPNVRLHSPVSAASHQ